MRSQYRRTVNRKNEEAFSDSPPSRHPPAPSLKPVEIDVIRNVIDSRHNTEKQLLDLSNFSKNVEFFENDMLMCLTKPRVMTTVLQWIGAKYPKISGISFSNNRLCHLEHLSALGKTTKSLKFLDLSHNQISTEDELEKLGKVSVERLVFEGNPVCERFTQMSQYVNFIQKAFPKCSNLDGIDVKPKEQRFDLDKFLPFRNGYYGNEEIRNLVEEFIIAYYEIYDGADGQQTRKTLLNAYDATNSTFTITITCLWDPYKYTMYPDSECYRMYLRNSHNVLNQEFFAANRASRISHGAMDIVVALSRLPATVHLMDTFVVDVFLVSAELLGFTLHGTFRDGNMVAEDINSAENYFTRTFIVAPKGEGKVAVISDQLFISSMSKRRNDKYRMLVENATDFDV
ncbi:Protein CBR-NXF-2 [Caenorhabditis briggsae]|uniref:NTF2 domain-containing protein n=2 Tax=Caenorhabditis briggsae TaxID=6238 RepID=A0AAE9ABI7_CAEBR|nr:Protein CBR-NXF-2 [Caenorhabditis briggsae]ULT91331.1 hypothetical protein L3Y34_009133 [Caenorhabditis briggsae]CAP25290.2 Protein CBR-NXF-2 [Caenorhabditis briggsae]